MWLTNNSNNSSSNSSSNKMLIKKRNESILPTVPNQLLLSIRTIKNAMWMGK